MRRGSRYSPIRESYFALSSLTALRWHMTSESITFTTIYLIVISLLLGITFGILDVNGSSSLGGNSSANITVSNMTEQSILLANFTNSTAGSSSMPNAQSVYESGAISVPASVKSLERDFNGHI